MLQEAFKYDFNMGFEGVETPVKEKKEQWTTVINDQVFNEDEIYDFLHFVNRNKQTSIINFVRFWVYHMIYFLGLAPIVIPIIAMIEGCKFIHNTDLFSCSFTSYAQFLSSISSGYFIWKIIECFISKERICSLQIILDLSVHLFIVIIARSTAISIKYSSLSKEHITVLKKSKLTPKLKNWNQTNNNSISENLKYFEAKIKASFIEEASFNVIAYENQNQFRV